MGTVTFDEWFRKSYPMTQDDKNPEHCRIRAVAEAAWNDATQLALARTVFKVAGLRRQWVKKDANAERTVVCSVLGHLVVELSEMS